MADRRPDPADPTGPERNPLEPGPRDRQGSSTGSAADTREPERAARMRAADDAETRDRQDDAERGIRAASEALEDSRRDPRDTGRALRERDRDLERTRSLAEDVAEGARDLRAGTTEAADAVRRVPKPGASDRDSSR